MANIFRSRSAAQLAAHLENYYKAVDAIAAGQSYTITSGSVTRTVTAANLPEIEAMIEKLETALAEKNGTLVRRTLVQVRK